MDKHTTEDTAIEQDITSTRDELYKICSMFIGKIRRHYASKVGVRTMSVCDKPFILCHYYVPLHTSKPFSDGWPGK